VPISQFNTFAGGLNLRDKADVVSDSEAIDLLNVTFTERGAVKQRDGYSDLTGSSLTNRVDSLGLFSTTSGTRHLIAGCGSRLEAINTSGAVVASQTGLVGGPYTFARFAAPGSEYVYCANGSNVTLRWDGATWTTGAASATVNGVAAQNMPKPGAVCITSNTNRLVSTAYGTGTTSGPGALASNPSRVHFSNVGTPETWETDGTAGRGANFIDLTPGDGEEVMAAVTWRELTFVFKQSKFFVFYGESIQSNGTPIFNYRAVTTGIGLAAKQAVCVAREGVYFMSRQGVYLTNGGEAKLVSDKVKPIWDQNPEVYFQSLPLNLAQLPLCRMAWHNEQVYLAYPSGIATANDRVLVYDTQHQWWSLYDLPASALISFQRSDQPELTFGYSTGNNRIGRLVANQTIDLTATTITSRFQSGWGDYGSPAVKFVRETRLWGTGAITVSFFTDYHTTPTSYGTVILGTTATWPSSGTWGAWIVGLGSVWPGGGQVATSLIRNVTRGQVFSTKLANSAALPSWSTHRVARHIKDGNSSFSMR
jgi:hypothetical protein